MPDKTVYVHTECGGEIDVKGRECIRCKKKWNPISFIFDPTGIRPVKVRVPYEPIKKPVTYAKWGDKIPGVGTIASLLPNWPRWARILAVIMVIGIIGGIVWFLIG